MLDRIRHAVANNPAVLVALVWALGRAFLDVDVDREALTVALDEALAGKWVAAVEGLVGGGVIRHFVYGPKTIDESLDAEAVIRQAELDG